MIGLDNICCTVIFKKNANPPNLIDKNLKNTDGTIYGNVRSFGEQIKLYINLPLLLRENNVVPFNSDDFDTIPYIKKKIKTDIKKIFGDSVLKIIPNAVEVNQTKRITNGNISDIIKIFRLSYLKSNQQLHGYFNKGYGVNYENSTGMLTTTKVNEYRLKIYNKTAQMLEEKNQIINPNTLRIELIIQGRRIRQTYGEQCDLFDVLNDPQKLIDVFIVKYNNDIKKKIKSFLSETKEMIFEELTQGKRPKEICARYRNIIVDVKQIENALKQYYYFCGKQDQSKSHAKVLAKSLAINSGNIAEINAFLHDF